jgi:hypothetical protein
MNIWREEKANRLQNERILKAVCFGFTELSMEPPIAEEKAKLKDSFLL